MMKAPFALSRENHLNHMVKVVPLIVMGYAIQCYFILQMGHSGIAADSLLFLGVCLGAMIAGFITYDLKHQVFFKESEMDISFINSFRTIAYNQIASIHLSNEGQAFSTMTLKLHDGRKFRFYFMDDADKIKTWILEQQKGPLQKAA